MEKEKLPWRSFADGGALAREWPTSGTPTFYVIDARGTIRNKWVGNPGHRAMDRAIEKLLEEMEAGRKGERK